MRRPAKYRGTEFAGHNTARRQHGGRPWNCSCWSPGAACRGLVETSFLVADELETLTRCAAERPTAGARSPGGKSARHRIRSPWRNREESTQLLGDVADRQQPCEFSRQRPSGGSGQGGGRRPPGLPPAGTPGRQDGPFHGPRNRSGAFRRAKSPNSFRAWGSFFCFGVRGRFGMARPINPTARWSRASRACKQQLGKNPSAVLPRVRAGRGRARQLLPSALLLR